MTGQAVRVATEDLNEALAQLMERSGAHPAEVHATRTCGLWVTELNPALWDREERARWDAAIDDYLDRHPEAEPF